MALSELTLAELKQGWHVTEHGITCNYCQASWDKTTPTTQLQAHLQLVHGGNLSQLIHLKGRYNSLTSKQQDLLTAFATGIKDQDLAQQLQVAGATIRHQKFSFREKAKRAKLYLATYDLVFTETQPTSSAAATPNDADETAKILQQYLDFDTEPVRLKHLPTQPRTLNPVLNRISAEIPAEQILTKSEIKALLKPIYFDDALVRRYLIDYGFLQPLDKGHYQRLPLA